MRTQCKERIRRRKRVPPVLGGHEVQENLEFVPDDAFTFKKTYGRIFKREEWGAVPPKKSDGKLTQPIMYIRTINLFMEGEEGAVVKGLKGPEAVRMFQKEDLANGLSDIMSNFIIDEDGSIYEGRGWVQKPGITDHEHPQRFMEYLEISFIGDFVNEPFNHPAHFATAKLCTIGRDNRYLSRDALMLNPKGFFYQRRDLMPRYLPNQSTIIQAS